MKSRWRILVVDDEPAQRESMAVWLREDGYTVDTAASGGECLELARTEPYDVYFLDLRMPVGPDGIATMRSLREMQPDAAVIIITAYATVDTAIQAIRDGAQEYVVKPCNPHELSLHVERVIRMHELQRENRVLRKRLSGRYRCHDLVSRDPAMHEVFRLVKSVADLRSTVLIEGESGTGKEIVARALHEEGIRRDAPFVAVPCVALNDSILESELFGHERGAFTGADEMRKGRFELAHGGTLLLDEVGDVSQRLQAELLRVLQERRFFRVGGSREVEVDVRVVAATNRDLRAAVRAGEFREDLYYRLNVIHLRLPPLRERMVDVPELTRHFLERYSAETGRPVPHLTDGALRRLLRRTWPGNVRELENTVERALATCSSDVLDAADLDFLEDEESGSASEEGSGQVPGGGGQVWSAPDDRTLREVEQLVIEATLRRTGGNVKAAAASLGIDRSTLYDKIDRYGIER